MLRTQLPQANQPRALALGLEIQCVTSVIKVELASFRVLELSAMRLSSWLRKTFNQVPVIKLPSAIITQPHGYTLPSPKGDCQKIRILSST